MPSLACNRLFGLLGLRYRFTPAYGVCDKIKSCRLGWNGSVIPAFHYEFEFIHPFADGNGRMGRLWQTLILSHWNPLFSNIPVESLVYQHQSKYYAALEKSTDLTDSAPLIEFMLQMILDAIHSTDTPQVNPQVTPQVEELLAVLQGEMTREQLQGLLELSDRKSFRERYLLPALEAGLIEMTLPDKPNSRLQKYRLIDRG